ncbi:hypothetical protein WJX77_008703 [Trebouxia sp. C0004]
MRHSDPVFASLLNVMRLHQPSQQLLDDVLGQCIVSEQDVPPLLTRADVTVLCALKAQVAKYNMDMLHARFHAPAVLPVPIHGSGGSMPELCEWFNDEDFHCLPYVAIGARVMVLENIDVAKGVANGSLTSVVDLKYDASGQLNKVIVEINETVEVRCITRTLWSSRYHQGKRYSKSTFPLMLAYALTVHKSQGATLDFAIVDLSDCFCPGLLYVAISRVRHRGCLRLMHRPTLEHAYPVPLPSIVTQGALHAAMPHPPSTDIEFGQSELRDRYICWLSAPGTSHCVLALHVFTVFCDIGSDMASPDQLLASLAGDLRRNPPPPAPGRTFKFSPKQLKALRMGRATPEEMAACRSQDDTSRLFDTLDLRRRHFKAAHDGEDRANGDINSPFFVVNTLTAPCTQIMLLTKWGELYDEEDMTYKEANSIMTGHLPGIRCFEVTTLMEDHGVSIDTIYSLKDLTRDQGEALVKRFTDRKRTASQDKLAPIHVYILQNIVNGRCYVGQAADLSTSMSYHTRVTVSLVRIISKRKVAAALITPAVLAGLPSNQQLAQQHGDAQCHDSHTECQTSIFISTAAVCKALCIQAARGFPSQILLDAIHLLASQAAQVSSHSQAHLHAAAYHETDQVQVAADITYTAGFFLTSKAKRIDEHACEVYIRTTILKDMLGFQQTGNSGNIHWTKDKHDLIPGHRVQYCLLLEVQSTMSMEAASPSVSLLLQSQDATDPSDSGTSTALTQAKSPTKSTRSRAVKAPKRYGDSP